MSDKKVEFKKENTNNGNSKNDMESNPNSTKLKASKYQVISINFLGEGRFDDELVLSYDY